MDFGFPIRPDWLASRGTTPTIANETRREAAPPLDAVARERRKVIERMFRRLKDFRRIATRCSRHAATSSPETSRGNPYRRHRQVVARLSLEPRAAFYEVGHRLSDANKVIINI